MKTRRWKLPFTDKALRLREAIVPQLGDHDYLLGLLFASDSAGTDADNLRGDVTLTLNQATTVISNALVESGSIIILTAMTANASAEVSAGTLYATYAAGAVTITHTNSATASRTFRYQIIP
jgi:hypothetical protein